MRRADQTVGPNPEFTAVLLFSLFSFISSNFTHLISKSTTNQINIWVYLSFP